MILIIGLATAVMTLLGGLFALKFKDKLHLILGFSAGAVVGVAFFDLMPESINLAIKKYPISTITLFFVIGFIIFMILDRMLSIHNHGGDEHCENKKHSGFHGATTLSIHSFLDGLGIGLAFKVTPTVGIIVAAAVLAHDFSDGINTVNYILKSRGKSKTAFIWLIVDAAAPILGIISTFFFTLSDVTLGLVLAIFCGFFLYIGASDLLPESHHQHPKIITTLMTILGILVLFIAIHFAQI
jgi:ZIP family zinc transporter